MESRSRVLLELHPKEMPVVPMAIRVGAYQAHWVRDPEKWQPSTSATAREQWDDLLRHLFLRYPVPRCLEQAWHTRGTLEHFDRDCYVAAAGGRSLRTVAGFPSSVTHRTLHLALHDCDESSLAQAIWRAQLKVLGAGEELERQVMASRVVREFTHHAFWVRLVESFARTANEGADFGLVADAISMATAQYGAKRGDQLLRLPLNELMRWSRKWWLDVLRNSHNVFTPEQLCVPSTREELRQLCLLTWMPLLGNQWSVARCEDGLPAEEWTMVELCSQAALIEEGRIMRHCVADYGAACRSGRSAIFSLRRRRFFTQSVIEEREVTLQVLARWRRVVQVRKYHNIEPNAEDMIMVRDWARSNGIRMSC